MNIKIVIVIFVTVLLVGCSSWNPESVQPVVDKFYGYMNAKDYAGAKSIIHQKWYEATSDEKTTKFFEKINSDFGTTTDYEMINWQVKSIVGTNGGTYFVIKYKAQRTIKETTDTITLYKPTGSNKFYVLGFNVYSDLMLE